jgi:hypothetical protein
VHGRLSVVEPRGASSASVAHLAAVSMVAFHIIRMALSQPVGYTKARCPLDSLDAFVASGGKETNSQG